MPYELIRLSSGLCVMSPVDDCDLENSIEQKQHFFQRFNMDVLSRQVCEEYLIVSVRAATQLGIPFNTEIRDNALIACIHDYEMTGSKDVSRSETYFMYCLSFVLVWCQYSEYDCKIWNQ
jgi:hypothetical protein